MFVSNRLVSDILKTKPTRRDKQAWGKWNQKTFKRLRRKLPSNDAHGGKDPEKIWPIVLEWLERLPGHRKMEKICAGFQRRAANARAHITCIMWWDIDSRKRHMMCIVTRFHENPVHVMLMWKKRPEIKKSRKKEENHESVHVAPAHASWGWDCSLQDDRVEIEGETYYNVVKAFDQWLQRPLPPRPPRLSDDVVS